MTETFKRAFKAWLDAANQIVAEHGSLDYDIGKRYIRIVYYGSGGRSAWAFVDKTNGDVLKPDGWKRPAKHARGNIYNLSEAIKWLRWTGPAYLR